MKHFSLVLFLVFFLALPPGALALADDAGKPVIDDILITTSQTHLLLFCSIRNGFTPEMVEGVHNGIPVTFTFFVELEQERSKWFDATLTEMTINHTLTYDPLKEQYQVTRSEKQANPLLTDSLEEAIQAMVELSGTRVIHRDALQPDAPYAIHVKAILAEKTLPLYMHYIIPFISLWDFETDWRTIEFRY
ncbi:MAG: hypothetical protein Kow0089_10880 [Desulfobulbaceae bacterium]